MATDTSPPDGLCVFAIQFGNQTPDRVHLSDRHDGLTCGLSILRPRHTRRMDRPKGQSVMATDTSPLDAYALSRFDSAIKRQAGYIRKTAMTANLRCSTTQIGAGANRDQFAVVVVQFAAHHGDLVP